MFSVQYKVVAVNAEVDGNLLSEENEGEEIAMLSKKTVNHFDFLKCSEWWQLCLNWRLVCTYLLSALCKELGRIDAIRNRVANEWDPVEDQRWLVFASWKQLTDYVAHDEDQGESRQQPKRKRSHLEGWRRHGR